MTAVAVRPLRVRPDRARVYARVIDEANVSSNRLPGVIPVLERILGVPDQVVAVGDVDRPLVEVVADLGVAGLAFLDQLVLLYLIII